LDVRIRGTSFSNWWLLLLIPLFVSIGPLLLGLFFLGNDAAGTILGPPAIWNRPWQAPSRQDLIGKYVESERQPKETSPHGKASVELRSDGTMVVNDLPSQFGEEICILTGSGKWDERNTGQSVDLIFTSARESPGTCRPDTYPGLQLAGHKKPYSLYWILDDPDSGTGIWLTRN